MHATLRPIALFVALCVPACYEPTTVDGTADETGSSSTTATTSASATSPTATQTSPTTDDSASSSGDTGDTIGGSTGTETTAADESSTTTGDPGVTICEHGAGGLVMCNAAMDGTPAYGMVACDPTVTDFSIFYEDVITVDLAVGDCLYVRVDNIGEAGATALAAADIAMQIRSPSGLFSFHDDDVDCSDPTWTGGACPQAQLTADVDGTYEIGITQVSGGGCINPTPYTVFAATNGAAFTPGAPALDDDLVDCAG